MTIMGICKDNNNIEKLFYDAQRTKVAIIVHSLNNTPGNVKLS